MPEILTLTPRDDLQRALDAAPPGAEIHLGEGVWRQKAVVRTDGLTLTGAGADRTHIVFGDYARKLHADGREYNTFRTYTLAVTADGVTLRGLSVANDALQPELKGQEVALSVYGDGFTMERCTLSSTQDTVFLGPLPPDLCERYVTLLPPALRRDVPLRQRFYGCLIEGTVDFIFGCGDTLFEECEIRSLRDARGGGYCAAPAHGPGQARGFLFRRCRFTRGEGVPDGSVYLARPWRDYGLAVFDACEYGAHIAPAGFDKWNDSVRDKTARFYERPPRPGRVPWAREYAAEGNAP